MPAYVICYLERRRTPARDTARELIDRKVSELWQGRLQLDSGWIVQAEQTSDQIRDALSGLLAGDDALLVIGTGKDAAWAGLQSAEADWLLEHI
jgi:hypothetical protein